MMRFWGAAVVALAAGAALAAACGATPAYAGPERDRAEVAVLEVTYYAKGIYVTVEAVDGRPVEGESGAKLALLPGQRVLAGRARGFGQPKAGTPYTLSFLARLGASYALELTQTGFSEKLSITVTEDGTGEVVASLEVWP
ncbi:MAG: hypothetical protein AB1726_17205 [Planctomycetota bacterium]